MKTLYLIRHAKSDWSTAVQRDFDRPLNKRGQKDVPFMAHQLNELGVIPDKIISSAANRAITTAEEMAKGVGFPEDRIIQKDNLYHATVETMLNELNLLTAKDQTVFLVGHNPGITSLSNHITDDYIDNIVTSGIVRIDFDIDDWQEIIQGSGTKIFYIYPKMYP